MKSPCVSVITPVFQTDFHYVEDCISSVMMQTYPKDSIELVLVVDGADRFYEKKIEELVADIDSIEVKLILNKERAGLATARNKGIACCKGEWLLILDSDDVLETTAISSLVNSIGSQKVLVYGDHVRVSSNLSSIRYLREKSFYHELLRKYAHNPIYNPLYSSVYISHGELIRKDALKEVSGYGKDIGEKPPVWISLFEKFGLNSMMHLPIVVYRYRENKHGICEQRGLELIKAHEQTFLESIRKHCDSISRVEYIGRIKPFMVKHFGFYDEQERMIKVPYINYESMQIVDSKYLHRRQHRK